MQKVEKEFRVLEREMLALSKRKLGFPTSLLCSDVSLVNNEVLGIRPNSLACLLLNAIGDPFCKSDNYQMNVKRFEVKLINIFANYFGIPKGQGRGYITSGGTEGNEAGLRWSKQNLLAKLEYKKKLILKKNKHILEKQEILEKKLELIKKDASSLEIKLLKSFVEFNKKIKQNEQIIDQLSCPTIFCTSEHTHYSIFKIAENLNLNVNTIQAESDGSMNLNDLEYKLKSHIQQFPFNPIIVNANFGTTVTGAMDHIPKIKKILEELNTKPVHTIHVDGALNGMLLPVLANYDNIKNYFKYIDTISISFHKYLGLAQPCGLVLSTKNFLKKIHQKEAKIITYAGNIRDITVSGSRSGFNILLAYNIIVGFFSLHRSAFKLQEFVQSDLKRAKYFYSQLSALFGKEKVFYNPNQFNIVFPKPNNYICKKYQLMVLNDKAVVCVLHNVTMELIDEFIQELKRSLKITNLEKIKLEIA